MQMISWTRRLGFVPSEGLVQGLLLRFVRPVIWLSFAQQTETLVGPTKNVTRRDIAMPFSRETPQEKEEFYSQVMPRLIARLSGNAAPLAGQTGAVAASRRGAKKAKLTGSISRKKSKPSAQRSQERRLAPAVGSVVAAV